MSNPWCIYPVPVPVPGTLTGGGFNASALQMGSGAGGAAGTVSGMPSFPELLVASVLVYPDPAATIDIAFSPLVAYVTNAGATPAPGRIWRFSKLTLDARPPCPSGRPPLEAIALAAQEEGETSAPFSRTLSALFAWGRISLFGDEGFELGPQAVMRDAVGRWWNTEVELGMTTGWRSSIHAFPLAQLHTRGWNPQTPVELCFALHTH